LKSGVIVIGSMRGENSESSFVSDCTNGLVGGFRMKLEEYEEDNEGTRARDAPSRSIEGNRGSS
jgi:hypothetical protein